jgi:acyl-CoA synthetase (AMP-forming)/AMP-acid ligase II
LPVRHYDWIAHFGRRTPDKVAAVDLASERRFTCAEFDGHIARLAAHLRGRLKVGRGDRVAVLALNTTDTLEIQFACGRIGAIFLPLARLGPASGEREQITLRSRISISSSACLVSNHEETKERSR